MSLKLLGFRDWHDNFDMNLDNLPDFCRNSRQVLLKDPKRQTYEDTRTASANFRIERPLSVKRRCGSGFRSFFFRSFLEYKNSHEGALWRSHFTNFHFENFYFGNVHFKKQWILRASRSTCNLLACGL